MASTAGVAGAADAASDALLSVADAGGMFESLTTDSRLAALALAT
jgi:hypothetical protein